MWYTGDNYVTVAGLTNQDQYNLLDYLTNGGKVIAMGQDLASTVDAAPGSQYNGLYNFGLGATWVQDSISAYEIPTGYATRAPSAPRLFSNVVVSLTQIYIDEIKPDISDNPYVVRGGVPVLNYGGPFNVLNGTVAMLHRDQPVLEGPVIPYLGRAFYTTFGLEGIGEVATDVLTTTTGLELMSDVLAWASSEPGTGTITDITPITTTAITIFSAGYTATVPAGYPEWSGRARLLPVGLRRRQRLCRHDGLRGRPHLCVPGRRRQHLHRAGGDHRRLRQRHRREPGTWTCPSPATRRR